MTAELEKELGDLRYHVQELGRLVEAMQYGDAGPEMADKTIDQWNWVINHAPKTLRAAKGEALGYACPECGHPRCVHKANHWGRRTS